MSKSEKIPHVRRRPLLLFYCWPPLLLLLVQHCPTIKSLMTEGRGVQRRRSKTGVIWATTVLHVTKKKKKNNNNNKEGLPSTYYGENYSRLFDVHPFDEDDDEDWKTTSTTNIPLSTQNNYSNNQKNKATSDPNKVEISGDDSSFSKTDAGGEVDHATRAYWVDECLKYFPIFLPFIAYLAYDPTAEVFAGAMDALGNRNWAAVDGGAYQAKIIAPAINGVVVPAISILFANLIGTTIQTLRQRQLDICTCLNMEAGQLRILQSVLDVFPTAPNQNHGNDNNRSNSRSDNNNNGNQFPDSATTCRRYLTQYTTRLIAESQPTMAVESLDYSLDTEMNGVLAELNRLSAFSASDPAGGAPYCSPILLGNAYAACAKLYEERAKRITALRSLFPPLHFVIVGALAVSICIAFLLETKQDILVFLNAIQLRILWTMLVGTFTALALVCYDLGNPFRGSYQISKSVHQLYTIRMTLRASLQAQRQQQRRQQNLAPLSDGLGYSSAEKEPPVTPTPKVGSDFIQQSWSNDGVVLNDENKE